MTIQRINSPIPVTVTTRETATTFHTVKLLVTASIDGAVEGIALTLTAHATGANDKVEFNISSVLRALADAYAYSPTTLTIPRITYTTQWWEEWLADGQLTKSKNIQTGPSGTAYFGGYTDYERITGSEPTGFTRKPLNSIETVAIGDTFLSPPSSADAPGASVSTPITAEGIQTVNGHTLYAVPQNRNRYQFRFINGLGALESVSIECYTDESVNYNVEQFQQTRPESMGGISHTRIEKSLDIEQWKFSTGPIIHEWRRWYAHEFLMSRHVWLFCSLAPGASAQWLPVLVVPEESTPLINRSSADLPAIDFTVKMNFQG